MNCCNDFGECKQGHGCPVREEPVSFSPKKQRRFMDMLIGIFIVWTVLLVFGTINLLKLMGLLA